MAPTLTILSVRPIGDNSHNELLGSKHALVDGTFETVQDLSVFRRAILRIVFALSFGTAIVHLTPDVREPLGTATRDGECPERNAPQPTGDCDSRLDALSPTNVCITASVWRSPDVHARSVPAFCPDVLQVTHAIRILELRPHRAVRVFDTPLLI